MPLLSAMTGSIPIVDRLIAARLAKPFVASIAIVIMLLSLENIARLMDSLDDVDEPMSVLFKFLFYLVPEYAGIGLILAVFVAVALCFRGLSLSGELDILSATGLSPLRILRVPLLLGLTVATLHVGVRGFVQPLGEQRLDALGNAIGSGDLGMSIKAGEFLHPTQKVLLYVEKADARTKTFYGVMVQTGDFAVFAQSAKALNAGRAGIMLRLTHGHIVQKLQSGRLQAPSFQAMVLPLNLANAPKAPLSARQRNDRLPLDHLLRIATVEQRNKLRDEARAACGVRFITAAFILWMPLFGFTLGIPPKRSTSAIGMLLGITLTIIFIQAGVALEDHASPFSLAHQFLLLAGFTGLICGLWQLQRILGFGFVEAVLERSVRRVWRVAKPIVAPLWIGAGMRLAHAEISRL
jgi:lipopolysaccharide export system permease protein